MKKYTFLVLFFSFFLISCQAFAGVTTLTSYYPPPTAAYNQVKLSITTYTATNPPPTCNLANAGTVYVDSSGNLHVCIKNPNGAVPPYYYSIYPQECYNAFCTYDHSIDPTGLTTCASYINGVIGSQGACPAGFTQVATDPAFQTSTNTMVVSIACCST